MKSDEIPVKKTVSKQGARQDAGETAAFDGLPGRKAKKVIDAALRLIVEQSFQHASMEAIAREAGVSKATLYAYFPSKNKLFEYLIVAECRKSAHRWSCRSRSRPCRGFTALRQAVYPLIRRSRPEETRLLPRLVSRSGAISRPCPAHGRKRSPGRRRAPCRIDAGGEPPGLLDVVDANLAARQFLTLVRGDLPMENALGLPAPSETEISKTIEDGLAFFFKAYLPPASH